MNIQEELKNKVVGYLLKEDLVDTDEVVNAFTLFTIIGEKLSQLEDAISLESVFNRINEILLNNKVTCEDVLESFHKAGEDSNDYLDLLFCFSGGIYQHIYKEVGKKELYLSPKGKLSDSLFALFIEDIEKSCKGLEEFATLFYDNQMSFTYQGFPSVEIKTQGKDFDTDFFYVGDGQIEKKLMLHFDGKLIDVSKQISSAEQEEILKKIPIEVKNLSPVCQKIYKDYQKSYQKKRV